MHQWTVRNLNDQNTWSEARREQMKLSNNQLLNSLNQSDKRTTWESPNQNHNSAKDRNVKSSDQAAVPDKNDSCENLVTKLKQTIADRIRNKTANNSRLSDEYTQSIKNLTTDMSSSREQMKIVKSTLLTLFDANEKLKQSNKTIIRENQQLTKDIEAINDEVNSLMLKLQKMNRETEMINKDVMNEGDELAMLKETQRQTAKDNDETIQLKRILTTSIVLARKEIGRLMNEVHGLVTKRATVRDQLDVLIKRYDN